MKSHSQIRAKQQAEAEKRARGSGYKRGGAIDEGDREAVHRHESALHKGQPKTKLRRGGMVRASKVVPQRIDQLARGGRAKNRSVHVNVMASNPQERQQAHQKGLQQGVQLGAKMAAAKMGGAGGPPPAPPPPMAPRGPMPMGAPGAGPGPGMPGAAPPVRPMGANRGGKIKVRAHERRAAGGKV